MAVEEAEQGMLDQWVATQGNSAEASYLVNCF